MSAFNDWRDFFDLLNYQGLNRKFSWAREGNSSQMALLDRFFINGDWEDQYNSTNCYYLPRLFYDHSPMVLDAGFVAFPKVYHFRFEIFWISQEDFSDLVVVWWSKCFLGSNKAVGWQIKIKHISSKMRGWSRNLSHSMHLKKVNYSSKAEHFEHIQENKVLDHDEILDLLDSKKEFYELHHDEVTKWAQTAKDKWVKEGDANTKYFHTHLIILRNILFLDS
jgi:hypothetical protein